jgi:hypothetical protein
MAVTDPIKITIYRWAGRKWFFRIRSECAECDLTVAQVRSLVSTHPGWPLEVEIKPWLTHLWESLRHGGWHAPVVLVDGGLLCQGKIPTRAELESAARRAFECRGISPSQQEQMPAGSPATSSGG